jgi:fucose 4-O-acetylase-like acetyltransferase
MSLVNRTEWSSAPHAACVGRIVSVMHMTLAGTHTVTVLCLHGPCCHLMDSLLLPWSASACSAAQYQFAVGDCSVCVSAHHCMVSWALGLTSVSQLSAR